jgi:folate-dependent phosphoribosylglycinamide formyltransferase PurN
VNILILTQDDKIFSYDFIKPFLLNFDKESSLNLTSIALIRTSSVGKSETPLAKLKRINKSFGPIFIFYCFFRLLRNKILGRSLTRLARKFNVPFHCDVISVNSSQFRDRLSREKVDLVVIVAGSEIVKKESLDVPRFGYINCHSSMLPADQGLMPVFWSLLAMRTGFTWYVLNEDVDSGRILVQEKTKIQNSFVKQLIYTKEMAAKSMVEAINARVGMIEGLCLPSSEKSYNRFPSRSDVKKLKKITPIF